MDKKHNETTKKPHLLVLSVMNNNKSMHAWISKRNSNKHYQDSINGLCTDISHHTTEMTATAYQEDKTHKLLREG